MGKQLKLNLDQGSWGGRRSNSGKKRIHSKGVAHRTREKINSRTPLHINFKFQKTIRNISTLEILKRALLNGEKKGLKVIHFSLQSNHVHLIAEAPSNEALTLGMKSILNTIARNKGSILKGRYHLHVLRSPNETKNAVQYVLFNEERHSNLKRALLKEYTIKNLRTASSYLLKKTNS